MASTPCPACSWTAERQDACRYESHVKLFYEASDRGVWSIGSKVILKERSNKPPDYEAQNIRFLTENTTIPVPTIIDEWEEEDGRYFILTKRIRGQTLDKVWATMSAVEKDRVAKQTAEFLLQLRQLRSPSMQSLNAQPLYSAFLFPNGYGLPHGPLSSDDELWAEMEKALKEVPEKYRRKLRERMPSAGPYTFTHGDLTDVNIMVDDGNLAGILDWESSGYFPVWWEFACAEIGLNQGDKEWKTLLQKHMPSYPEARDFWKSFNTLCSFPPQSERVQAVLRNLQQEIDCE